MMKPITTMTTSASKANMMIWLKAPPRPSDEANQARPKPAAKPPSMAPHGRLGATGAGVAAGVAGLAAELVAALLPAGAWRCVTLGDCLPNEEPPPRRLASAAVPANVRVTASTVERIADKIFISSP